MVPKVAFVATFTVAPAAPADGDKVVATTAAAPTAASTSRRPILAPERAASDPEWAGAVSSSWVIGGVVPLFVGVSSTLRCTGETPTFVQDSQRNPQFRHRIGA